MKVKFIEKLGTWRGVADAARYTINMEAGEGEPSSKWIRRLIMSEHSPLRRIRFTWRWEDLPSWVSVHFVRHKIGIEHFVGTQRDDRKDITPNSKESRAKAPQDTPVIHTCDADAQAIVNISRKRLCNCASPETREAFQMFLDTSIKPTEPELYASCVPECIYRNGLCPEFKTCGYNKTPKFEKALIEYVKGFEDQINTKTLIK